MAQLVFLFMTYCVEKCYECIKMATIVNTVSMELLLSPTNYTADDNTSTLTHRESEDMLRYIPWFIIYGLICAPTVFGNVLLIKCLFAIKDNRSSIHIWIGNLSMSDLIVGGVLLPYCVITDALELNSCKYFCLTKSSLMVFAVGGTTCGLFMVSVDRFSAVCFPFKHHKFFSPKRVKIMLLISWSYVGFFAFLPLSGWNFYDRNLPYSCTSDQVLTPIYQKVVNAHFAFGLTVNITLYMIVIRIALKKARKIYSEGTVMHEVRHRNIRELYRVKTMAIVQGLFALCWFPYIIFAIIITFMENETLKRIHYWCIVPGLLNSAFNWIIYGYRNKQLRTRMKMYIVCWSRPRRSSSTNNASPLCIVNQQLRTREEREPKS